MPCTDPDREFVESQKYMRGWCIVAHHTCFRVWWSVLSARKTYKRVLCKRLQTHFWKNVPAVPLYFSSSFHRAAQVKTPLCTPNLFHTATSLLLEWNLALLSELWMDVCSQGGFFYFLIMNWKYKKQLYWQLLHPYQAVFQFISSILCDSIVFFPGSVLFSHRVDKWKLVQSLFMQPWASKPSPNPFQHTEKWKFSRFPNDSKSEPLIKSRSQMDVSGFYRWDYYPCLLMHWRQLRDTNTLTCTEVSLWLFDFIMRPMYYCGLWRWMGWSLKTGTACRTEGPGSILINKNHHWAKINPHQNQQQIIKPGVSNV